ncbi:hypothetical protein AKJ08_2996 [Vulgatibacter incomptus]|uniref:HEAT repeat domain-containing protein n=2 Tax=Vulgatibacter incomptus TaxID=1391653 RepID=A0A0K1PHL7_9BACT|nr:hypothetical protein AKJ08_2996 [Vulgatibacter incomptus]
MPMSILERLASPQGLRTQEPNEEAAALCLESPELLEEIATGLASRDARLAGDCAEVMTKVGERRPEVTAPYAEALVLALGHKNGRVRWESAHALALVADRAAKVVEAALPTLEGLVCNHDGVIVRDYAIDSIARWGTTAPARASRAWEILRDALTAWDGRHAHRILGHGAALVALQPRLVGELRDAAASFVEDERAGTRKAAKALAKALG